jgi:HEAT repeat protein
LPALIGLLSDPTTRDTATESLMRYGRRGLDALEATLHDPELPRELRWRATAAIARFEPPAAARSLLSRLSAERDGLVRYGCLTALEGLARRHPDLPLDRGALDQSIADTLSRAYRYVDRRHSLVRGAELDPRRATPGHELLAQLLHDKGEHALDRLFRLLALCYPHEDFRAIQRGLASAKRDVRASSLELIESILGPPLRDAVLGLVDDVSDQERLPNGRRFHAPLGLDYEGLLRHMLDSASDAVQELTLYHIGELGLTALRAPVAKLAEAAPGRPRARRTLALLEAAC